MAFADVLAFGFGPAFGFGVAFAVEAVLLAAGLVVVVAFFRGLLVVLPVCAFGLDAGFDAKERRPMLMTLPLKLHVCSCGHLYPVWEVVITRRGLNDSCATRSVADGGPLPANRRTIARPVLTIMTIGESISVRIYMWDQFVKTDARGFGGMKRGKLCSSRDAETIWMAGSLRSKEVGNRKRDEPVPFEPVRNAAQGYLKLGNVIAI